LGLLTYSSGWNEGDAVKPSLAIDLQGLQIDTLAIAKADDSDVFLNTEIPGFIGNAYDFHVEGTFAPATLTFEFDSSLVNSPDFAPAIYYWNEKDQKLDIVPDQIISGNFVIA